MFEIRCNACTKGKTCEFRESVEETYSTMIDYVTSQREKHDLGDFKWSVHCGNFCESNTKNGYDYVPGDPRW